MVESTKQTGLKTISEEHANRYIRTGDHLYAGLVRNKYKMPKKSSALCTIAFMQEVRDGTIYCPRWDVITALPKCFSLPPRNFILDKIVKFVDQQDQSVEVMPSVRRLIKKMKKRSPDAEWLVDLLGQWDPNDEIFSKNYVYVRPRPATAQTIELANDDDFYTDLPLLPCNVMRKTRRMRVPKSIRVKAALKALEARQQKLAAQHEVLLLALKSA